MDKKKAEKDDFNNISLDEMFRLMDLHFNRKNVMFRHLYDSYDKFLDEDVKNFLENCEHIITEEVTAKTYYKYRFEYINVCIESPMMNNGVEQLFPSDARENNYTYSVKLFADVSQWQDTIDIMTDIKIVKQIGKTEVHKHIGTIPLMLRSKYCNLTIYKGLNDKECDYDPGGYFIVKGNEKVIIPQDKMVFNKPVVVIKKDSGVPSFNVQVNSKSNKPLTNVQTSSVKIKKDGIMIMRIQFINEVNICVIFRALGLISDRQIVNTICYDENDTEMIELIRKSINSCKNDKDMYINTQADAIDYLLPKMRTVKKYTETDAIVKLKQKKMHLLELLKHTFLPHIEGSQLLIRKAKYLGYMVNRLLQVFLGRVYIDDRDSYVNKRIDLVGDLCFELYKAQDKKVMTDCKKQFNLRNESHENPLSVISHIKANIIEQGFKASLSTGKFMDKAGVAQMVQVLSYLQKLLFLRRVDTPDVASTGKLTSPRYVNPSSVPFLDCSETPEHVKVGLTKHLSIISSITVMTRDQYNILKEFLEARIIDLVDIDKIYGENSYKVFLNGEWLGNSIDFIKLGKELLHNKLNGLFDQKNVSIVEDHDNGEIRVYCDSGRLVRPTLLVENNCINLKKSHIDSISLNKMDKMTHITDWDEFLMKYPGIIEYIDMEAQPYLLVCEKTNILELARKKMVDSIKYVGKKQKTENRYGELHFVKYSNCEFHPSLLSGVIIANSPFIDRNQGPRNLFIYNQGKQAMGMYATNYRDRLDISYILYHIQRPLINTRASKYINTEILPAGENCMVAIACYTGYNQEDSLIFNKTSIERGKFRATFLKKYFTSIQKNQSTTTDDKFMKPDPAKVLYHKHISYNKLNDKGFAPPETKIEYNDVIFGKVTPIQETKGGAQYKDSSEIYKMHVPGVIDRVYIDSQNEDGYFTRKCSIRSERVPKIGDKYSCYDDQTEVLTDSGWIFFKDLTTKHKVASLKNDDTLVYVNPVEVMKYDYDGKMYSVQSNQIDLCVTPNHRMYIKKRTGKYCVELAENILNQTVFYKKNAEKYEVSCFNESEYINQEKKVFILPAYRDRPDMELPLNEFIEFFGIWIAEGWADYGRVMIAGHKQRVKDRLDEIVPKMGFKISKYIDSRKGSKIKGDIDYDDKYDDIDKYDDKNKHNYYICDIQLAKFMQVYSMTAPFKYLPPWVWTLRLEQCRILMNGMICGDGHQMKGTCTMRYDTSSYRLADDFQRLCLHAGYSCNIGIKELAGKVSTIVKGYRKGETITSRFDAYRMSVITVQNKPKVNKDKKTNIHDKFIDYTGKVYCCRLPDDLVPEDDYDCCCDTEKKIPVKERMKKDKANTGIIYVRRNKTPCWSGNSKHGQKGTIGLLLAGVDMPFSERGIKPDIILNPNAIPSRMTIGQLIECLVGKTAVLEGMDGDGTPFETYDIEKVKDRLEKLGYERNGNEFLYNGMTGEKMEVSIFFGPTYYQRLKHLVEDKIHSRAKGPTTALTRQAPEGRSRDGGLRLGEMERDVLIAHGLAKFLKEKLIDDSDPYTTYVCGKCGLFAQRFLTNESTLTGSENDLYFCHACKNYEDIHKIKIPYAFKLCLHELTAMNIAPRIRCEKPSYE
jgi:DNA-directed RNA polymerase II subunit RPB2